MVNKLKTEYTIQQVSKDKTKVIYCVSFAKKEEAIKKYKSFCENEPACTYRLLKTEVSEEIIAQSEDYRQTKFSF